MTEMGPHAMKKRTLKSAKKKKELDSNADPKLYHGARGRYHYFLCLQWLFRNQVATLIQLWDLPPEFEVLCRDIWALHLDLLREAVPAEPFIHAQNEGQVNKKEGDMNEAKPVAQTTKPKETGHLPQKEGRDGYKSESGSSSDSDLNEQEMEQLMKENSELSSSETDEEEGSHDPPNSDGEPNTKKKRKKGERSAIQWHHIYESPPSTIAVLIVACWILRIPCLYRDFARAIESYKLPYLDPVRLLPQSMAQHLTKHTKQALSPRHAPTTIAMHKLASRLAKRLHSSYAIFTPEANAPSILWRVVRAMGGTPTLYGLTKHIASILSLPLTMHSSLAPGLRKKRKGDPGFHQMDNVPIEVSLMASCIIVLKMVYGLDGVERLPQDAGDPACAMPRYETFLSLLREMDKEDANETDCVFSSDNPMRLEDLSEDLLDNYLAFCERALTSTGAKTVLGKDDVLDEHFPIHGGQSCPCSDAKDETKRQQRLPATELETDQKGKRALKPGEEYRIWNARDVLGTLPSEYELVLGRAARWVGVGCEYLGGVVEKYERRIVRWHSRK